MFSVPLFAEQSLQELRPGVAEFREALLQPIQLDLLVAGRAMRGIHLVFARLRAVQQPVRGNQFHVTVVDQYLVFGDPHRKQLAHAVPGNRVTVVAIADKSLHIDHPVNDLRRVVVMCRKGQQVGSFLGICVDGPFLGRAVYPHIRHIGEPPASHFVEMFQGAKRTAVEQAFFHIVELPFDFSLRFWRSRPAGPRGETVMRGKGEKSRVVDRLIVFPTLHDHLHVVVQAGQCDPIQVFEPANVLPGGVLEVFAFGKTEILASRVAQDVAKQMDLAASFVGEIDGVRRPVRLRLLPRSGFKANHWLGGRSFPELVDEFTDNGVTSRESLGLKLFMHPLGRNVRVSQQQFFY